DEPTCVTSQSFTITVKPTSDSSCRDCGDNTANITVVGQTNCSGNTCRINATEGQTVTLSASATGSHPGYTYQWRRSSGNVGSGATVNVGPFSLNDSPTFTVRATDS